MIKIGIESYILIKRFLKFTQKESFFLFGPRGTGKSTWLKESFPDALWINLLEPDELLFYSARPERLRETLDAHPQKKHIVIDEIQKIPVLLSLVHSIMEEKRGLQFVLTGSSSRKLKRQGVDLLSGRALLYQMHPFMAGELQKEFSLDKALTLGLLPIVWDSSLPHKVLDAYVGLYLKEEVQEEGIVRQAGEFARFLEAISFSHGSLINATNIARECDINRKTVQNYLNILEDLLLSYSLTVFAKRAKRAVIEHQKFYLCDVGVFRHLRPRGPIDRKEELEGPALEGLVGQHLRAWIALQDEPYKLHFWQTRTKLEVDFIIYGAQGLWAIEVKNGEKIAPQDLKGLKAFKEEYPESKPLLLYRGKRRLMQEGILMCPVDEFLMQLAPNQIMLS